MQNNTVEIMGLFNVLTGVEYLLIMDADLNTTVVNWP